MIVILCDSFQDAQDSYWLFLEYIEETMPSYSIIRAIDAALLIDTDDDIRYMFVSWRYQGSLFEDQNVEFIEKEVFFEDLYSDEKYFEFA